MGNLRALLLLLCGCTVVGSGNLAEPPEGGAFSIDAMPGPGRDAGADTTAREAGAGDAEDAVGSRGRDGAVDLDAGDMGLDAAPSDGLDAAASDAAPVRLEDGAPAPADSGPPPGVDSGPAPVDSGADAEPAPNPPRILVGRSSDTDPPYFVVLRPGADIPINSAGQSGVVLDLAVRSYNLPAELYLTVVVTPTGQAPVTVREPGADPDVFVCYGLFCDLTPFRVATSALGAPLDVQGTEVTVEVIADDGAGTVVSDSHTGVLMRP